jgi:hypothetical protein
MDNVLEQQVARHERQIEAVILQLQDVVVQIKLLASTQAASQEALGNIMERLERSVEKNTQSQEEMQKKFIVLEVEKRHRDGISGFFKLNFFDWLKIASFIIVVGYIGYEHAYMGDARQIKELQGNDHAIQSKINNLEIAVHDLKQIVESYAKHK